MEQAWIVWTIIAAIFAIGEIFTAGFFLFWFAIGAAVAALFAWSGLGSGYQLGAFVVVSTVLVFFTRRFAEKFTKKQPPGIGADRMIGKIGIVLEDIDNLENIGLVRIDKEEWRAESEDGNKIEKGARIEVCEIDGAHVIVKPVKEGAQ